MRTLNFNTTDDKLNCHHCGAEGVQQWALDRLQQIRTIFGKPMVVTSAFRCADHPAEASKVKPGTHNKGVAFDILVNNAFDRATLVYLALQHGARGIGIDKDFVHIDFDTDRPEITMWSY